MSAPLDAPQHAPGPAPAPPNTSAGPVPWVGVVGVVLVVIGAFGSWARASVGAGLAGNIDVNQNGMDADGTITFGLAIVAGVVLVLGRVKPAGWQRIVFAIAAALIVLVAIIDVFDVRGTGGGLIDVSVGWGLWLTLVGGIVLAIAAVQRFRS